MPVENKIMLITYADSMGKNIKEMSEILKEHFKGAIGGVHILPFFPSSADRGFAPMTYETVDGVFGDWSDMEDLSEDFYLMYDFMINHISRSSEYYRDFIKNKDRSPYADLFIRYKDFWPGGEPTQGDIDLIYKRKPRAPYIEALFEDGTSEKIWCTFNEEQVDLNCNSKATREFIKKNLLFLSKKHADMIRLDAFAYATKKVGTNCFFVEPEVWELLEFARELLKPLNVEILPEIHEHYTIQLKLAGKGYWIYDFALPMLMLHAIYSRTNRRIINWLRMSPAKQFTTLDTHDGIGVVDVRDLMSEDEIEETKENLFSRGANVKKVYNTMAYNNLDIYQINCTYYSALGDRDDAYLLARAVQFFAPGIPQVYYVGLMAGKNDIELLERTKQGRDINRHYYTKEEIEENLKRPVVQKLCRLMEFRNSYPAFQGKITVCEPEGESDLKIVWVNGKFEAVLNADFGPCNFTITYYDEKTDKYEKLKLDT